MSAWSLLLCHTYARVLLADCWPRRTLSIGVESSLLLPDHGEIMYGRKTFSCGIVTWDFPVCTSRSAVTERGSRSLGTSTAPSCPFSSQACQRWSRRRPSHPSFATCGACLSPQMPSSTVRPPAKLEPPLATSTTFLSILRSLERHSSTPPSKGTRMGLCVILHSSSPSSLTKIPGLCVKDTTPKNPLNTTRGPGVIRLLPSHLPLTSRSRT